MLFIQDLIQEYPSYVEIPVQWGDMDAMGCRTSLSCCHFYLTD
ncbi:hypothetical protein [Runella sp.]|jgi:hypothetical protein